MKRLRSYEITEYLKGRKYCSIRELTEHFQVSNATIYRDIAELEARDVIRKVHGGVAFHERQPEYKQPGNFPFQERISWNDSRKQIIAAEAMKRICENDILFLDSSTTVFYLAELLEKSAFSSLTIITNSVMIIENFHKYPSHYVRIGLGGSFDVQLNSFLGQSTLRELEYLEISKAFISAFGVEDEKVTTNHEHHATLLMKVLELARQKYLLIDRSKIDRSGLFKVISSKAFDEILTD
jgi:DeoR/GlpR family transcriptional regulator of sugar metabolism